jgi:hypothetical protein
MHQSSGAFIAICICAFLTCSTADREAKACARTGHARRTGQVDAHPAFAAQPSFLVLCHFFRKSATPSGVWLVSQVAAECHIQCHMVRCASRPSRIRVPIYVTRPAVLCFVSQASPTRDKLETRLFRCFWWVLLVIAAVGVCVRSVYRPPHRRRARSRRPPLVLTVYTQTVPAFLD